MQTLREQAPISLEYCHLYAPNRIATFLGYDQSGQLKFDSCDLEALHKRLDGVEGEIKQRFDLEHSPLTRLALLDNVESREKQLVSEDPWRVDLFEGVSKESLRIGAKAEVHLESHFISKARLLQIEILERAKDLGLTLKKGKISISTSIGIHTPKIFGFKGVEDPKHPSCCVLDMAWTIWRTQNFSRTFTVLPLEYSIQQQQVAALAALLEIPRRNSVTAVFLDDSGTIINELKFGSVNLIKS